MPRRAMALVHATLLFQLLLVRSILTSRSKSFVILDEVVYRSCWAWRLGVVSSQPRTDVVDWPDWLVNQRLASTAEADQPVDLGFLP